MFQISVPPQAGNSGGPLVDSNGNVIGVVTAKLSSLKVLRDTGDFPQNVNYAIKSNYLLEVVSGLAGLEAKLLPPRSTAFPDLEHLAASLSRSIGVVSGEHAEAAPAPIALPQIWKSLTSGNQYSVRLDEPYLQWVQLSSPTNPYFVSGQGEAKRIGQSFSGSGNGTLRNPSTQQTCTTKAQFTFSLVTPRRIEGEAVAQTGFLLWDTCQLRAGSERESRSPFVWVPQ